MAQNNHTKKHQPKAEKKSLVAKPAPSPAACASGGVPFKAHGKSIRFESPDAIDSAVLETFDYAFPGREIDIITASEEFTSVCPFSGLPDFGRITISYVPAARCVELRSLKYYLLSFRNVGIFYEHLANRILEDLLQVLAPRRLEITLQMTPRGGLATTIRARYDQTEKPSRKTAK